MLYRLLRNLRTKEETDLVVKKQQKEEKIQVSDIKKVFIESIKQGSSSEGLRDSFWGFSDALSQLLIIMIQVLLYQATLLLSMQTSSETTQTELLEDESHRKGVISKVTCRSFKGK